MASNNSSLPPPPMFVGENYHLWAAKMKTYLRAQSLWDVVENGSNPPPLPNNPTIAQIKNHNEEVAKEGRALAIIHAALHDDIFIKILNLETAKEAWNKLKEEFQGSERTKKMQVLNLRREFEALKMKETEAVREFSDRISKVVSQITLLGEELSDQRVVEKNLVCLPGRFEAKISSLEENKDFSQITLAELVNALQATEQRKSLKLEENVEGAFVAKGKNHSYNSFGKNPFGEKKGKGKKEEVNNKGESWKNFPTRQHCKKDTHLEKYCWYRPDVKCRACNQLGHVEKVCKNKANQQRQRAQVVEHHPQEEQLFMASCYSTNSSKETWLIDSGCINHMTHNVGIFKELDKSFYSKVTIGNGEHVDVKGKGVVAIETPSGIKYIADVLFVPEINQSLLSVGQMMEKNYTLHFKDKRCTILDPSGSKLMTVGMRGKSFPIEWKQTTMHAFPSNVDDSSLWHRRLGHFSYSTLKQMSSHDLVENLPIIDDVVDMCDVCQFGKQSRLPFPVESTWRASEKLQLIHTDVCGPMPTTSLNGNKYFLLFIDDFTRMCWVFFLRQESDVFPAFQSFKLMVEKEVDCQIKKLRSDNGNEYTAGEFKVFCEQVGIQHQFTVPYTPQQNGVSERKNRTVMEMARCLLFEKGIPKTFWAEAVNTSVYLLNLLPTKVLKGKTPFEAWYERKPSVEHLRIFGCVCYLHVPNVKRDKLETKSVVGIFLGYSSNSKGYRIYNLETKKILVSRDVQFDEFSKWNWEKSQTEGSSKVMSTEDSLEDQNSEDEGENYDNFPTRGTRTLDDIYARCNIATLEPTRYAEAANVEGWKVAMQEEMKMIEKNQTWQLVDKPENQKIIGVKWVYRTKLNPDGSINKLKARLVVKGYFQQHGVDFSDTFAPVARHDTIRLLVALAAKLGWKIYHFKLAFLNGLLDEDIYVDQPEGFKVAGSENKVYKLHKALYGLKQAPRAWYSRIDGYLLQNGFKRSENEATLYVKWSRNEVKLIVSLYVDDLLVIGNESNSLSQFKQAMENEFEMTDLGEMKYFLGMEIFQSSAGIFISQKKYALEVLKKFHMDKCKSVSTPLVVNEKLSKDDGDNSANASIYRSIIGSLLYLSATRPDIMFAASLLSRFMHSPSQVHLGAAKRVLRYIKGTTDYGLCFLKNENEDLQGYIVTELEV
ncbi:hypothetical protein TSUD_143350 [Trifolium subterraneum]|uniref:Integrase catalytic domain-containing protein n=1 Tax=Trifolium subterraneum TaxID=3900 RepID=A0A2Z6N9Q0_TRISU|nr:hypothetical protein TSUD_143350 [Trifolium subterraneum]